MLIGTVKWFHPTKGYGFIGSFDQSSEDVFVHIRQVNQAQMSSLRVGQRLRYEIQQGPDGKTIAVNLSNVD